MSFVLGVEPFKRRPFPIKTRVIWVPDIYIYNYIYIYIYIFLVIYSFIYAFISNKARILASGLVSANLILNNF